LKQELTYNAQSGHHNCADECPLLGEEWRIPGQSAGELTFSDADSARAQLIRDLKNDLGVNDEGVGVILSLVDQVHGLRWVLTEVLQSVRSRV
jgi:chaperone modulatory protein CbpM